MRRAIVVARRELLSALNTPPAYVFCSFFLVVSSVWLFFARGFFARGDASLRPYFEIMPALLAILMPALTMRSWAEEKKSGTYELLATLPFRTGELVAGKFLATLSVTAATLALSLSVPLSVSRFGDFDAGILLTEYLGVLVLACACAALGQWVSSHSRNQVSAFLLTAALLLALSLVGRLPSLFRLPPHILKALTWISLDSHFESFSRGVLDSRDLLYFLTVTGAALYLTAKSLVRAAWR